MSSGQAQFKNKPPTKKMPTEFRTICCLALDTNPSIQHGDALFGAFHTSETEKDLHKNIKNILEAMTTKTEEIVIF